ncbi:MAG: 50S ribosomal protein L19 [Chloroflexota bacterium]|nr:50S ribosomal protein L19 [Chloroflexota bacterium]
MDIQEVVQYKIDPNIPQIHPGDAIKLSIRTTEGDKERLQHFQGMVIRLRKSVNGGTFTVRKISYGIGVEYTLPFQSTAIKDIEVLKHGKVRRAKLYYMRHLSAKQSRLKERQEKVTVQAASQEDENRLSSEEAQSS